MWSLLLENDYLIVKNALPEEVFKELSAGCRSLNFKNFTSSDSFSMQAALIPKKLSEAIDIVACEATGIKLHTLNTFARLNSAKYDLQPRIHSDGHIMGEHPDIAMVLYTETSPGFGTALFSHPVHGDRSRAADRQVFTENCEEWKPYVFYEAVANSVFIYKAEMYHCRYPFAAYGKTQKDGRIVIVKFFKELK